MQKVSKTDIHNLTKISRPTIDNLIKNNDIVMILLLSLELWEVEKRVSDFVKYKEEKDKL
jgi:hypothetical protein